MSERPALKRGGTTPDTSVKGDMPRADTSTPPTDAMTVQPPFFGTYFIISLPPAAAVRRIGHIADVFSLRSPAHRAGAHESEGN